MHAHVGTRRELRRGVAVGPTQGAQGCSEDGSPAARPRDRKGRGEPERLLEESGDPQLPEPRVPPRSQSVPASPPCPACIADRLTLRLRSGRHSGAKFDEPSLFRCPHGKGWAPPLFAWAGSAYAAPRRIHSPQGHGQKRARAPRPERPRLLPSSIQQPRRQPRAPLEPLGSSGGFLSLKQCCCVTHMRFPAMLCNGKMAEEKKRASEQRAEPFCCRAGRGGTAVTPRQLVQRGPATWPTARPPPPPQPEERGHVPGSRESHPKASFCLLWSRFRDLAGSRPPGRE